MAVTQITMQEALVIARSIEKSDIHFIFRSLWRRPAVPAPTDVLTTQELTALWTYDVLLASKVLKREVLMQVFQEFYADFVEIAAHLEEAINAPPGTKVGLNMYRLGFVDNRYANITTRGDEDESKLTAFDLQTFENVPDPMVHGSYPEIRVQLFNIAHIVMNGLGAVRATRANIATK